ncbi:MAG: Integrator complex subunit 5, partial [Paramarteilia canceri]
MTKPQVNKSIPGPPHTVPESSQRAAQIFNETLNALKECPASRALLLHQLHILLVSTFRTLDNFDVQLQIISNVNKTFDEMLQINPLFFCVLFAEWCLDVIHQLSLQFNFNDNETDFSLKIENEIQFYTADPLVYSIIKILVKCVEYIETKKCKVILNMIFNGFLHYNPNFDWLLAYISMMYPSHILKLILNMGKDYIKVKVGEKGDIKDEMAQTNASIAGIIGFMTRDHSKEIFDIFNQFFHLSMSAKSEVEHYIIHYLFQIIYLNPKIGDAISPYILEIDNDSELICSLVKWMKLNESNKSIIMKLMPIIIANSFYGFQFIKRLIKFYSKTTDDSVKGSLEELFNEVSYHIRQAYLFHFNSSETERYDLAIFKSTQFNIEDIDMNSNQKDVNCIKNIYLSLLYGAFLCSDKERNAKILANKIVEYFESPSSMSKYLNSFYHLALAVDVEIDIKIFGEILLIFRSKKHEIIDFGLPILFKMFRNRMK